MNDPETYEDRMIASQLARATAFSQIGELDPHVLGAHVESGPHYWPTQRVYQVIGGDGFYAIASNGLSDPWEDADLAGLGVEFVLEVDSADAQAPWVFSTITNFAEKSILPTNTFSRDFDELGTLSWEIQGHGFPNEWRTVTGRVGVLLNVRSAELPEDYNNGEGTVRVVPITVLHPAELAAIVVGGEAGVSARNRIAAELAELPRGHASRFDREVVPSAREVTFELYVAPEPEPVPAAKRPWWKFWQAK